MGFAYWVCHTLTTLKSKLLLLDSGCGLNDAARKLLLQARDCMQKYTGMCLCRVHACVCVCDIHVHVHVICMYATCDLMVPLYLSTARNTSNGCAFNYLGLLCETEGLLCVAKEAFKRYTSTALCLPVYYLMIGHCIS